MTAAVRTILKELDSLFPEPRVALNYSNPLQLLVATILSAQCTDERVNRVTADLFRKYRKAADYAQADLPALEEEIRSTGFYKNKARTLKACGRMLVDDFGGKVPARMEELTRLPGVGRKTANFLLGIAFGQPAIAVDTHVARVAQRLGLTREKDADRIEAALQPLIPKTKWTRFFLQAILHGRHICRARNPLCERCPLPAVCPAFRELKAATKRRSR